MRVAFLNRPRNSWGGDLAAIDATRAALAKVGVETVYDPARLDLFDLIHIVHVNFNWSRENFRRAREAEKPYVVTPTFYPGNYGMSREEIRSAIGGTRGVMPFSQAERKELEDWLDWQGIIEKWDIIPNGTDPMFHACTDDHAVGVCTAAARDYRKGTERVEAACQSIGWPFTYLTGLPPEQMAQEYRKHKVFVSMSESERMSLVIGEALCSGCRVIATTENRGNEWYPGLVRLSPAAPIGRLAQVIREAYDAPVWDWRPNEAARKITWDSVAVQIKAVYERVLCTHPA